MNSQLDLVAEGAVSCLEAEGGGEAKLGTTMLGCGRFWWVGEGVGEGRVCVLFLVAAGRGRVLLLLKGVHARFDGIGDLERRNKRLVWVAEDG